MLSEYFQFISNLAAIMSENYFVRHTSKKCNLSKYLFTGKCFNQSGVQAINTTSCAPPKIQRRLNNFRASGSILTGLFSDDAPRGRGDKLGTIFTIPAPKNL